MMLLNIILVLGFLALIYCGLQFIRNERVFDIRMNWIETKDERHERYTYGEMFNPSEKNFFGLNIPRDKFYK